MAKSVAATPGNDKPDAQAKEDEIIVNARARLSELAEALGARSYSKPDAPAKDAGREPVTPDKRAASGPKRKRVSFVKSLCKAIAFELETAKDGRWPPVDVLVNWIETSGVDSTYVQRMTIERIRSNLHGALRKPTFERTTEHSALAEELLLAAGLSTHDVENVVYGAKRTEKSRQLKRKASKGPAAR